MSPDLKIKSNKLRINTAEFSQCELTTISEEIIFLCTAFQMLGEDKDLGRSIKDTLTADAAKK